MARDPTGGAESGSGRSVTISSSGVNSGAPCAAFRRGVICFVPAGAASVVPVVRVTLPLVVVRGAVKKPLARVMVPLIVPFGVAVAEKVTGEPVRPAAVADV